MRVSSFSITGLAARIDGMVAGWVHSGIRDEAEQQAQVAFFRVLVLAALALLVALPLLLLPAFSAGTALAAGVGGCALALLVAAILCATGSRAVAAGVGLAAAAAVIAAIAAQTGGDHSPFMVWLGFLPLGAVLAGRNWQWLCAGFALAMAAGAAVAVMGPSPGGHAEAAFAATLPIAAMLAYVLARISLRLERGASESRAGTGAAAAAPAWRAACELLPGVVTLHDPAGLVTAVHGAETTPWLKEPMGRGFIRQVHVADRIVFMQALDALRQGSDRMTIGLRMHCLSLASSDDQFVHLRMDLTAIRDSEGRLETILAQSRDMTAEAAKLKEAEKRAEAAEAANAAKTRFLAAVSHELRTPLSAIIGFSDVLSDERFGAFANDRQREYVELIRQSGGHLLSVVNALLDMSRVESGCYELAAEPVDVRAAVTRAEAMLALQAKAKGVLLTSRVSRACGEVVADRRAVDQILINLVANAVKFTEKGGVVSIDAEMRGDRLRLSVSDTGIGISAEHLQRVGEPFVQLAADSASSGEGAGLGLSLVKGLVALHGGGFAIRSRLGEGTVVAVELARDGSGLSEGRRAGGEGPIAFPPRLPAENLVNGTEGSNGAQARTA